MNSSSGQAWTLGDVDFEKLYQGEPPTTAVSTGFDVVPWDIGEPQPVVVRLAEGGQLRDNVLDVGCGLGENSVFLAGRGYQVTGVDGAETALEGARRTAAERDLQVRFVHTDVTTLDGLEQEFGTVLDSALYHCLDQDERSAYAAALHRVTLPGARLHLFCFADVDSGGFRTTNDVSQDDLRTHLGEHWDIDTIELTEYVSVMDQQFVEQRAEVMQELGFEVDPDAVRFDEQGRLRVPVWQLHAVRR